MENFNTLLKEIRFSFSVILVTEKNHSDKWVCPASTKSLSVFLVKSPKIIPTFLFYEYFPLTKIWIYKLWCVTCPGNKCSTGWKLDSKEKKVAT